MTEFQQIEFSQLIIMEVETVLYHTYYSLSYTMMSHKMKHVNTGF